MRKLLNNPWVVTVLALGALLFVGYSVMPHRAAPVAYGPSPDPVFTPEDPAQEDDSEGMAPRLPLVAALDRLPLPAAVRNPFAIPAQSAAEANAGEVAPEIVENVILSATWVQNGSVLLLLNGQIYGPGETVLHCQIESADIGGAWLVYPGGRSRISVGQTISYSLPRSRSSVPLSR